jgi:hypothetical protein
MKIQTHIRTLAAAALLALPIVSVSAGQVHAEPRHPKDNGVRCALEDPEGSDYDWEFYLPGDVIEVQMPWGTERLVCGADGEWHPARTRIEVPITPPVGNAW